MKAVSRVVALVAALNLALWSHGAMAAGSGPDRVGDVRASKSEVRVDKANGKRAWVDVGRRTRVVLVDKSGQRTVSDLNELSRGAKIVGKRIEGGRLAKVVFAEKVTGSSDCSFDSSEDDGDEVSNDDSFDCSNSYNDGDTDTDSDCSYDSSTDGVATDWSMDASWDCSYSESDSGDEDGLDWDCSYSASAGGSEDDSGGDVDADLDFDCSWSGASTDSVLWDCNFKPGVLGFRCVSTQLGQDFEYTIDLDSKQFVGGMDFTKDFEKEESGEDGVACSGSAVDGYDCSFDGEAEAGDCNVDWSFDSSREVRSGDVSGSLSYDCGWESMTD